MRQYTSSVLVSATSKNQLWHTDFPHWLMFMSNVNDEGSLNSFLQF